MRYQYEFDKEKCWWKNSCLLRDTCECNGGCIRFMKMHYLATNSLLTLKQQHPPKLTPDNKDIEAFNMLADIKNDISDYIQSGKNLVIYSSRNGNGKTTWAIKLMMSYFSHVWPYDSFTVRGLFINVAKLLSAIKDNMTEPSEYLKHIQSHIDTADVVIWDDIGMKNLSGFEHDYLYNYINSRIDAGKSNIFTANLVSADFRQALGDRLYSRIVNGSDLILFSGTDKRRPIE